jgi:lysophospholipase L1-like esterase
MSVTSQFRRESAALPPRGSNRMLTPRATIVWLLQLLFPTIGLAHVGLWLYEGFDVGRLDLALLVVGGLWYAACLGGLALSRVRRWIAAYPVRLVVLYICGIVGLVTAEVICRSVPLHYDPRLPHITRFSPELGWMPIPGAGGIGEHGFRLPSYPREKPPGHFRIVCLGDSTTFGSGCSWQEAYPHQLEIALNHDAGWSKSHGISEVLNFGFHSYGPDQALLVLKNHALPYSPDVVIFQLNIDDFADASFDHQWQMNYGATWYRPFFVLRDGQLVPGCDTVPRPRDAAGKVIPDFNEHRRAYQLYLFSFLRTLGRTVSGEETRKKVPEPTKTHWPIHDNFRTEYLRARPLVWALIKEMAQVSHAAGAVFLVTLSPCHLPGPTDNPPWRVARFFQEYQTDAQAAGTPVVNCVPEYFAEGGNDRFLLTHVEYLNPEGNAFIARAVLRWLKEAYQPLP